MNIATHPVEPEEIMAWLDGELSDTQLEAVSAHVEQCVECSQLAEQLRAPSQSLSAWGVPVIPNNLEKSIVEASAASDGKIAKPRLFVRASLWNWKQWALWVGAPAMVLLIVIAVSNLSRPEMAANHAVTVAQEQQLERYGIGSASKLQYPSAKPNKGGRAGGVGGGSMGGALGGIVGGVAGGVRPGAVGSLITSASPGIAADSNGMFHGIGEHAVNSFSTDGQPVTDQQSKIFSNDASAPMIARTVSMSIVVKDFTAARASLDTILNRHHGYAAQLSVGTPENAPKNLVASLRIPAPELSSAIAELRTLGRVENESQSGEEVTEQHADLVARLKNSRDTEDRLRAILEQRTGKITDVLQVEREIARVRGDIERMEAEQKALEHRVDFATVELQLTEEFKAEINPPAPSVSTRIHNALVAGYQNATETVLGILLFFAENGPVLLIWLAILAFPVMLVWRRYRRLSASV